MTDFFDIAVTPAVLELQKQKGSLGVYTTEVGPGPSNFHTLDQSEIDFLTTRDSFYMATPSSASVWSTIKSGAGITVADRAEIDQADIATTGPPLLPALPHINYVLRRNPTTADNHFVRLVAEQIEASFDT